MPLFPSDWRAEEGPAPGTRDVPVVLQNGQRFTAKGVSDQITDEQLTKQLGQYGASLDMFAIRKSRIVNSLPTPGLKMLGDAMIPGSWEALLGDSVAVVAGLYTARKALLGGSILKRAGQRVAAPVAGGLATGVAGEISGDRDQWQHALGLMLGGAAFEGAAAGGRAFLKNVTATQRYMRSEADGKQLGKAVSRFFPNTGTEVEMRQLFREGGAEKITGQVLGNMEKTIFERVGPRTNLYVPSLNKVNEILKHNKIDLPPFPIAGRGEAPLPISNLTEIWPRLQQLRALRRSALRESEPMLHQQVLAVTKELEDDLVTAFRQAGPDAIPTFMAHKIQGRKMYAVDDWIKHSDAIQTAARPEGAVIDLNGLRQGIMDGAKGKANPVLQELVESGVVDVAHGIMPEGSVLGAADTIYAARGTYGRSRVGDVAVGSRIPLPEMRRMAVPERGFTRFGRLHETTLRPIEAAAAGQAAGGAIPSTFQGQEPTPLSP
mgnify:CR=1 FL=1